MWYEIIHVIRKSRVIQLFYQSNLNTFWNMKLYYKARAWETKLQRVALRNADSNDATSIATTRIAVNQALKLQN